MLCHLKLPALQTVQIILANKYFFKPADQASAVSSHYFEIVHHYFHIHQ